MIVSVDVFIICLSDRHTATNLALAMHGMLKVCRMLAWLTSSKLVPRDAGIHVSADAERAHKTRQETASRSCLCASLRPTYQLQYSYNSRRTAATRDNTRYIVVSVRFARH